MDLEPWGSRYQTVISSRYSDLTCMYFLIVLTPGFSAAPFFSDVIRLIRNAAAGRVAEPTPDGQGHLLQTTISGRVSSQDARKDLDVAGRQPQAMPARSYRAMHEHRAIVTAEQVVRRIVAHSLQRVVGYTEEAVILAVDEQQVQPGDGDQLVALFLTQADQRGGAVALIAAGVRGLNEIQTIGHGGVVFDQHKPRANAGGGAPNMVVVTVNVNG